MDFFKILIYMKKTIIIMLTVLLNSCSTIKPQKSNQRPFPKNFDEAEQWCDSVFNVPIN